MCLIGLIYFYYYWNMNFCQVLGKILGKSNTYLIYKKLPSFCAQYSLDIRNGLPLSKLKKNFYVEISIIAGTLLSDDMHEFTTFFPNRDSKRKHWTCCKQKYVGAMKCCSIFFHSLLASFWWLLSVETSCRIFLICTMNYYYFNCNFGSDFFQIQWWLNDLNLHFCLNWDTFKMYNFLCLKFLWFWNCI